MDSIFWLRYKKSKKPVCVYNLTVNMMYIEDGQCRLEKYYNGYENLHER